MYHSAKVLYYCVEWDDSTCSWDTFRSKVLGATDPADAPAESLRSQIAAKWKELGLPGPCDVGDNAVHASASPFEAMIERCNWLTSTLHKVLNACLRIQLLAQQTFVAYQRSAELNMGLQVA